MAIQLLTVAVQMLTVAVQNAVPFAQTTLARSIGGKVGVAVFAAGLAPPGAPAVDRPAAGPPATATALHPVFLLAAGIAAIGFALTWTLREVPLCTARAREPAGG
jgi:hypothetical protein